MKKTFKDLVFKKHGNASKYNSLKTHAVIEFENGYGVSVITGGYGNEDFPYELAVLYQGDITYNTSITDDVEGYLTAENVSQLMLRIQEL